MNKLERDLTRVGFTAVGLAGILGAVVGTVAARVISRLSRDT